MSLASSVVARPPTMIEKHQRLCVWVGLAFVPVFGAVFILMGWLPPPSPNLNANEIARIFGEDRNRIRIGMYMLTFVAPLLAFFGAALTHQCRMLVGNSPLVWVQALCAAVLMLEFLIPQMVWQTALFRTERAPETVQMLNDQAWLLYLGVVGTVMVQLIVLAICIFQTRAANR